MTLTLEQLRRKADQAWEMAGLARQDGDKADELRRTEEAREYERQIKGIASCVMILKQSLGEFIQTLIDKPIPVLPVRHELFRNKKGQLVWRTYERDPRFVGFLPLSEIVITEGEKK